MEKIIIVEALSTGFNLIEDCVNRGYEPVILETYIPDEKGRELIEKDRAAKYIRLKRDVKKIRADADYAKTLEMVRAEKPLLVIPGNEDGVILATRLGDDLELPGNSYKNIDKMTDKSEQQKALERAGLRSIRGKVVKTEAEAAAYFDSLGSEDVVVKPIRGVCSVGVRLCHGKEEMLTAFRENQGAVGGLFQRESEMLIQERIIGIEYIVNTLVCKGKITVTSIWEYEKVRLSNGSNIYRGMRLITEMNACYYELVQYAYKVTKAIGITHGPVHGEYMIDKDGPVLIEANCRCMGSSFPAAYGDAIYGHHETDLALDSYLDGSRFEEFEKTGYQPKMHAMLKDLAASASMSISSSPIIQFLPSLKSYFTSLMQTAAITDSIEKTIDLETTLGTVYMCHKDRAVLEKDYQLLCILEHDYFGLLHNANKDSRYFLRGKEYDDLEDLYFELKSMSSELKAGEKISFTRDEINKFPYGLAGFSIIMHIFDMKLLLPRYGQGTSVLFEKKAAECQAVKEK